MDENMILRLMGEHRKDVKLLNEAKKELAVAQRSFKEKRISRGELEKATLAYISIALRMARRFHPLTSYGRELLERAVNCRKDFEKGAGLLLTQINTENMDYFEPVLTKDMMDTISFGKYQAIGSMCTGAGGLYAVGALVYHMEEGLPGENALMRIDWLYIDRDYSRESIADMMIGEIVYQAAINDLSAVSIEFSWNEAAKDFEKQFGDWQFALSESVKPEFVCRLGDIKDIGAIQSKNEAATSLGKTGRDEAFSLIRRCFDLNHYNGYLQRLEQWEQYYEMELSCFTGSVYDPVSLALVHRYPSGMLRVEFFAFEPGGESEVDKLVCELTQAALRKYPKSTLLVMPVGSLEFSALLDITFPEQIGALSTEGMLFPVPEERDLYTEDIESYVQGDYDV